MASMIPGVQVRNAVYGIKVERAAAALPQTTTGNLFQITGGRIVLTTFVGEVTTAIQAQANNLTLNYQNAAIGGAGLSLAAAVDSNGAAVGTLFSITGTFATAAALAIAAVQPNELILSAGLIRLTAAASNTGAMKWALTYIPFDDGATVAAV